MPCTIPESISNPVKPKHPPPRYDDLNSTSVAISDSVSSPIVTCLTTAVYGFFALAAIDRMTDLIFAIVIAAKNTEAPYLPSAVIYIIAMMFAGFLVHKGMYMVLFRDRFMEDDTLPNRVTTFSRRANPNGSTVTHGEFMSDSDVKLLKIAKDCLGNNATTCDTTEEAKEESKEEAKDETKEKTKKEATEEAKEEPAPEGGPKREQEEITPAPRRTLKRPIEEEECYLMPM